MESSDNCTKNLSDRGIGREIIMVESPHNTTCSEETQKIESML